VNFFLILEKEKQKNKKKRRKFPSEALSFPAAGSPRRGQLVSPKRGRVRKNEAVQGNSPLDTAKKYTTQNVIY
jgi:hypothetical protein